MVGRFPYLWRYKKNT